MKRWTASVLVTLLCACAGGKSDITKPLSQEATSDAAKAYNRGMQEKADSNYLEATRYFETVRNNFPYSQYAALSELALADMAYARDEYASAATAYQEFVKSHPSHAKAGYAAFRVGLAHFEDRASDWMLLPPSYERDETPVKQALDAFQRFVTAYPKSEFVTRARDLINDCRQRLAAHDRYVASFYWKREAWVGAAARLISLADNYGDLDNGKLRSDSLFRAAVAYQKAKDVPRQRQTLERLVEEVPASDPHHGYAVSMLKALPRVAQEPPAPLPGVGPLRDLPETPTETPGAPGQRPEAAPGPGQVPADAEQRPIAPPEGAKPSGPTNQVPPEPGQPSNESPTPPLADPHK